MNKYKYLTYEDRKQIEKMYGAGERPADIALELKVHTATIYNELKRGYTDEEDKNLRPRYSAEVAQRAIQEAFKRRGIRETRKNKEVAV